MECRVIASGVFAAAVMLTAAPSPAQNAGLARCLAVADRDVRLACYDRLARADGEGARAPATTATPAGRVPAADQAGHAAPAPAAAGPRAEIGFGAAEREARRAAPQKQLNAVTLRVATARAIGAGYWQFAMDDGSVWRLTEVRNSYRPPRAGDEVKLLRASLGSYLLVFRGQPSIGIRRID